MPYTPPTVNYSTTIGGTYTTLTGIQAVNIVRGRNYFQDNFKTSQCYIELIPANTYATPLAVGQFLDVRTTNSASSPAFFVGRITDVQRVYEMPYTTATGAAPADRIIITATGGTGIAAQNTFGTYTNTRTRVDHQIEDAGSASSVIVITRSPNGTISSATTVNDLGAFDFINKLLRTGQYYIDDYDQSRNSDTVFGGAGTVVIYTGRSTTATFSDTGSIRYNQLTFESSAQSTFNRVNVFADGLAVQTTQGTAPFNTLDYYTYNDTTATALSLSGLLYNMLNGLNTIAPYTISTSTVVDDTWLPLTYLEQQVGSPAATSYIGSGASIIFRGSTYTAQIQQIAVNFYPDQAEVTFTFSPSLGQAFTLDSSQFGILDTNRLGYP